MNNSKKEFQTVIMAFLTSLVFVAATLVLGVFWETNDDPGIAYLLSYAGNNYSPFQWRIFSGVMHFLYVNLPIIDWWAVNTIVALWAGAFACSYVIYRRFPKLQAVAVCGAVLMILWVTTARSLNFTRTAAAVAAGGMLLLADSVLKKEQKNPVEFAFGCLLMVYSASIRSHVTLIALGFLAVIGAVRLLANQFSFSLQWIKDNLRWITGLCLCAAVVLGSFGLHRLCLTPAQKEFEHYNTIRSQIQDYPQLYPAYEALAEEYEAAGFDEEELDLFLNWYSEDTEHMPLEVMEKVAALKHTQRSLYPLAMCLQNDIRVLVMSFVLGVALMLRRKQNFLRIVLVGMVTVACNVMMSYLGRLPSRVFVSILLQGVCAMVFLAGEDDVVAPAKETVTAPVTKLARVWPKLLSAILCLSTLVCLYTIKGEVLWSLNNLNSPWEDVSMEKSRAQNFDLIHKDTEHIYIVDIMHEPFASVVYNFSFWEPKPAGYCENYFVLGGWSARHPYMISRLAEYGITNPTRALFENPAVYSTYSPRTFAHLCDKYDEKMTASETATVAGAPLVQYAAYIDDSALAEDTTRTAKVKLLQNVNKGGMQAAYVSVELEEADPALAYYCNLTVDSVRYTYRLGLKDSTLSALLYGIGENAEMTDLVIIAREESGDHIRYAMS